MDAKEQINKQPAKKTCKITNLPMAWTIEVDGKKFVFVDSEFAEYLAKHYTECGYDVIQQNNT